LEALYKQRGVAAQGAERAKIAKYAAFQRLETLGVYEASNEFK